MEYSRIIPNPQILFQCTGLNSQWPKVSGDAESEERDTKKWLDVQMDYEIKQHKIGI